MRRLSGLFTAVESWLAIAEYLLSVFGDGSGVCRVVSLPAAAARIGFMIRWLAWLMRSGYFSSCLVVSVFAALECCYLLGSSYFVCCHRLR